MMMQGQKLFVDIVQAQGLASMNHFTGDHPYVQCEVKHLDRHARKTTAATKPVTDGDTHNPVFNERLEIDGWQPGEDLEFTIYDKGLIGAKTEGKVLLPSANFYPQGFNGMLPISGLPNALLQVAVQPGGAATSAYGASTGATYAAAAPAVTSTYSAAAPAVTSTYSAAAPSGGVTYSSPVTYSSGTPMAGAAPVTFSSGTPTSVSAPVMYSAGTPTAAASPMMTTMAPSTTYSQSSAMPMQTYGAPTTTYSASTPMISTTPAMPVQASSTYAAAPMQTYAASPPSPTFAASPMYATSAPMQTYAAPTSPTYATSAPMQTYAASPPSPTYMQQPQSYMMQGGQAYGAGGYGTNAYKLAVSIIQAQGLRHMNHFTGDHPYVVCEVKHAAHRERRTKVETRPVTVGDTLNPVWNETLELEPFHQGDHLEFTVYDKGLIGSKTEGKVSLPGEMFFSNSSGFSGMLPISGLSQALLTVAVRIVGTSNITVEANSGLFAPSTTSTDYRTEPAVTTQEGYPATQTVLSKKRSKKLKVGSKKKSGCC